ncbi:hypothetical protein J5X84_07925 [Streptosporangiaceae bacterium NEAU-GS5]|nr:hypothetical protein [Streptosporangiaceae bacterium NEAU-GS5]
MLPAYTDESFNKAFHFITALLVPGQAATSLTTALDGVVAAAWEMHSSLPLDAELHALEMWRSSSAVSTRSASKRGTPSLIHRTALS